MKHANLKGYLHGAEKVEDIFYRRDVFSTEDAHPRKMASRATFFRLVEIALKVKQILKKSYAKNKSFGLGL